MVWRLLVLGSTVLTALCVAACDRGGADAPGGSVTVSTTSVGAPFELSKPFSSDAPLDPDAMGNAAWLVVDVDARSVTALRLDTSPERYAAQGGSAGVLPTWEDEDTLFVRNIDGKAFLAELDGAISAVSRPTPLPQGERLDVSVGGGWSIYASMGGPEGVVVHLGAHGDEPRFRITSTISPQISAPQWSPVAPALLALITDACVDFYDGFNLSIFDAAAGEMRDLSTVAGQRIARFSWRPDGAVIAAGVVFSGESQSEARRELALIDVNDGASLTLAHTASFGVLLPGEWSPDGTKLLVQFAGVGSLCEELAPLSRPTEVQRIRE